VGGDYAAEDETGDIYLFTTALAERARRAGAEFRFSTQVSRLLTEGGRIQGVELIDPEGLYQTLTADAYVAALGSDTPRLVAPLGVPCKVYPAKGYSATFDIVDSDAAPTVSLTDSAHKVVYTRIGKQIRMAGTAELSGYSRALNTIRCDNMLAQARDLFPNALDFATVRFWSGLRPSTPSNVPLIGRTRISNLYMNTGHGTLGWTMGAGSGRALADLISGKSPEPDFPFLG
jgi:D-amino-acid dehydrogenase